MTNFLRNWLLRGVFCVPDVRYIFKVGRGGEPYIEGKIVSPEELKRLKAEVHALQGFRLWQIFQETLRDKATETAIKNSTNFDHVLAGKTMLLNLDFLKQIVDVIDNYQK